MSNMLLRIKEMEQIYRHLLPFHQRLMVHAIFKQQLIDRQCALNLLVRWHLPDNGLGWTIFLCEKSIFTYGVRYGLIGEVEAINCHLPFVRSALSHQDAASSGHLATRRFVAALP